MEQRRIICEERTYKYWEECETQTEKWELVASYEDRLNEVETKINLLKRKQKGNYVSLNGESKLDMLIRLMGVIMKERDIYLSN